MVMGGGDIHQQHPAPIGSLVCSLREATQVLIDHLVVHESEWGEREREGGGRVSTTERSKSERSTYSSRPMVSFANSVTLPAVAFISGAILK